MLTTTPFSQTLTHLNKGAVEIETTEELAKLVKAVRETGKAGQITLTLKVSLFNKNDENMVKIDPVVTAKIPELEIGTNVMWSTADGDLLRDDPEKMQREVRAVDTGPQTLKTVSDSPRSVKSA